MIACEFDAAACSGRIVLRPNRSLSWRANLCVAGTLMGLSGSFGTVLALRGFWPLLPFTVVEGLFVLACLYCCARRTHYQEVLTFSAEHLLYESGIGRPRTRKRFQRYFTRFFVRPAPHPWYRPRIALRCRDQELEIGSYLSREEQADLIAALREMIHRLDAAPRHGGPQAAALPRQ